MKLLYKLKPEDYLQHALFYNSVNKGSKNLRLKAWLSVILSFIFFGILLYLYTDSFIFNLYAILAILVAVIFPYYHKYRLKKQYLSSINENYKNSFGTAKELLFDDDFLHITSESGISKLKYSAIECIQEISSHYFLNLKSGTHIILPKSELKHNSSLQVRLNDLCKKHKINHTQELDWKW